MKTLYFECGMGAAGDMLMAALLELHPDPQGFIERLNGIGIPRVRIEKEPVRRCGISGTGIRVLIDGETEEHIHEHGHTHEHEHEHTHVHEHEHEHTHKHEHSSMHDINDIICGLNVSDKIKNDALAVYGLIAEAEGNAHACDIDHIHFHEVGSMDAVADITGVCMLIDELAPDRITASPIHVGSGTVKCAHGILPVPAPATEYILRSVPIYGGRISGELCTPTGAALLKYFVDEFVEENRMVVNKTGYGMGKRSFYDNNGTEVLSTVRAMLGDSRSGEDKIILLSCNIDDMTGEQMGFAVEQIMAGGALDVFTAPIYMKKNRPGMLLTVLCRVADKEKLARLVFKYTTTIGIRELAANRYVLERTTEVRSTEYGDITVKHSEGYGVKRSKAEYEDLRRAAIENNMSLSEIIPLCADQKKD